MKLLVSNSIYAKKGFASGRGIGAKFYAVTPPKTLN